MKVEIQGNSLELRIYDITKQTTDAIVNAANGTLLGGGGVDGAIHRAAGGELLEECKQVRNEVLNGKYLPTGEASMTKGYHLTAKFVIDTVGLIWNGGSNNEEELLSRCYQHSLQLAAKKGLTSISFPSISTGVYRFPMQQAAVIAMRTIANFLKERQFGEVVMVLFSKNDCMIYEMALNRILAE
ncbi:O-acetyl-ADP-ribose deacetylase [Neobacillus terrae]|uniref:O-acetyl-ADP-ribose deacetylase n=1 Tax=Neobacillus terrae TaxID=3034837 RepID=UPI00140835AE|nr:O-acetyl-ADP-ribose deacetylase [Neobacillus terrae]NHM31370.1 O-acetyl-ADP-ribose deacetylase [Neobacillus terrae]